MPPKKDYARRYMQVRRALQNLPSVPDSVSSEELSEHENNEENVTQPEWEENISVDDQAEQPSCDFDVPSPVVPAVEINDLELFANDYETDGEDYNDFNFVGYRPPPDSSSSDESSNDELESKCIFYPYFSILSSKECS